MSTQTVAPKDTLPSLLALRSVVRTAVEDLTGSTWKTYDVEMEGPCLIVHGEADGGGQFDFVITIDQPEWA